MRKSEWASESASKLIPPVEPNLWNKLRRGVCRTITEVLPGVPVIVIRARFCDDIDIGAGRPADSSRIASRLDLHFGDRLRRRINPNRAEQRLIVYDPIQCVVVVTLPLTIHRRVQGNFSHTGVVAVIVWDRTCARENRDERREIPA